MFLLKLIILVLLFVVLFYQLNRKSLIKVPLNVDNLFIIAFIGYTLVPLLEVFIYNEVDIYSQTFISDVLISVSCINLGVLISRKVVLFKSQTNEKSREKKQSILKKRSEVVRVLVATILCIALLSLHIVINKGGYLNYFTMGYGNRTGGVENSNIASLAYSVIAYAIIFNNKKVVKSKTARIVGLISTMCFVFIFLIGGNRNFAVMTFLGLAISTTYGRRFNLINVGIAVGMAGVGLGIIAVFREHGISNIVSGDVVLNKSNVLEYALNFRKGELGTTLKFSKYAHMIDWRFSFPYAFGYSYFILPIINLIPRSIWPTKPMAYADYFSSYAFGDSRGIGFGFSPIYEAKINFFFMWGIVFVFYGMLLCWISKQSKKEKNIKIQLFASVIGVTILNFFRIDFTTYFKFIMMIWIFVWLFYQMMKPIRFRIILR